MRNNPNKVIKVITKNGEEYRMFLTGKQLLFYLLVFEISFRGTFSKHSNVCELHAPGQTKEIRFFCDEKELLGILEGGKNG